MGPEGGEEETAWTGENGAGGRCKGATLYASESLTALMLNTQDLEEVEEWNEYGELKDNINASAPKAPAPATPTPSTANTPSKPPPSTADTSSKDTPSTPSKAPAPLKTAPSSTDTPPRPAAPSSTDSPLTTAMRQAGFEAAKKAGDAKTKARSEALEAAKAQAPDLKKQLDDAAPAGMPPPSGTTEAEEAIKPEKYAAKVEGKADGVGVTDEGDKELKEQVGKKAVTEGVGAINLGKEEAGTTKAETDTMEGVPSSKDVEASANKSIYHDKEESEQVLEGKGQAEEKEEEEVPSSKEVAERANASIMHDKSHVVMKGRKAADQSPPPLSEDEGGIVGKEEGKRTGELDKGSGTDAADSLSGKKTQDQPAASREHD